MSTARDLIPTALPLPLQDIHPDELKVILAEAAARHKEAEAALQAAQDHFDAADRQRQYALSEEQKRQQREEQSRINRLRELVPHLQDDAERFARQFREACAEETVQSDRVLGWFVMWSRTRMLAHKAREVVVRYDAEQSREDYISWERRVWGWGQLIRSVTSYRKGGALLGDADDVDGLAAVNLRIAEESKDAPRALTRDPSDETTPFVEDLGVRDPARTGLYNIGNGDFRALEFNDEFSKAVYEASTSWARQAIDSISADAREKFNATAAKALDKK
jgi:hypothetical protein